MKLMQNANVWPPRLMDSGYVGQGLTSSSQLTLSHHMVVLRECDEVGFWVDHLVQSTSPIVTIPRLLQYSRLLQLPRVIYDPARFL
jgi:hypothetical protein